MTGIIHTTSAEAICHCEFTADFVLLLLPWENTAVRFLSRNLLPQNRNSLKKECPEEMTEPQREAGQLAP